MIVVTAGHVDHGKTSLVRAITGIETDRLKEEQARGLTIDLGFAYTDLNGLRVGFVDVPGHIRFIHNMLAGVSGVDLALLIVAADDGPMPQTLEHLAIIEALQIPKLLVALTKIDRVDIQRVDEAHQAVSTLLQQTAFRDANIVRMSNTSGEGVNEISRLIAESAIDQRSNDAAEYFRLPIDRVFTIKGAGTVATGTVLSGSINVGDQLQHSGTGRMLRVRKIHAQDQATQLATKGHRCALNLVALDGGSIGLTRGDWLTESQTVTELDRVDLAYTALRDEPKPLKHWTAVHVFHASTHRQGHLAVLGQGGISPGDSGYVQLSLDGKTHLCIGDRIIFRDQGATRTLGWGQVINTHTRKEGRAKSDRLQLLQRLHHAKSKDHWLNERISNEPSGLPLALLSDQLNWPLANVIEALAANQDVRIVDDTVITDRFWRHWQRVIVGKLEEWHLAAPTQRGFAATQLTPHLPKGFALLKPLLLSMIKEGSLAIDGAHIRRPQHEAQLSDSAQSYLALAAPILEKHLLQPPVLHELATMINRSVIDLESALKECAAQGYLVHPTVNRFMLPAALSEFESLIKSLDQAEGFSVQTFRDASGIGRNLAIEMLEYFDRKGLTRRDGNVRFVR
jgi:selenocysteine-specific elongation factor